ncbi:MAG TPA: hypothetical protein VHJ34_03245 [Actinomycetota bacterium]|nr:hypothetical protein [Actinomycetota bacterium]
MGIEVTDEAVEVLRRSLELFGATPRSAAGVRLRMVRALGGGLEAQVEFASEAAPGDREVDAGGVRLFVDPGVVEAFPDALVTVDPQHDDVVVRPAS